MGSLKYLCMNGNNNMTTTLFTQIHYTRATLLDQIKIGQLVCRLYGLTVEEIAIVEEGGK